MKSRSALLGLAIVIALGIASRRIHLGIPVWDKSLGDVLYTVMVYFFVALAAQRWSRPALGGAALGISFAIEVFQATGIPARLPRVLQIALGTTFAWHDMACYVIGAAAITVGHELVVRSRARGC